MVANLLLDYATFNFDAESVTISTISDCISDIDLKWRQIGLAENSPYVNFLGMSFLNNSGFAIRPHRLQVPGTACRHIEPKLPELRRLANNHLSRVDFAFDVVVPREKWKEFIKRAFSESLDSTRQAKKFILAGSGEAMTVYIGKRKCAKFCRIYNKSLEDKDYSILDQSGKPYKLKSDEYGNPLEYIIRYEIELKRFKSKVQDFDPSYLFDSYFDDQKTVINFVMDTWRLYAEEFLLPCPLDELQLKCNYDKVKFCSKEVADQTIKDRIYDKPQVFNSTVEYVAARFGKYIPFILTDPVLRYDVTHACDKFCGLKFDFIVSVAESGFYDIEKYINESEVLNPYRYVIDDQPEFEQIEI